MAWERRGNARYFYVTRRAADGRVVKEYLGRGRRAQQAARVAAAARLRAEQARRALAAEEVRLAEAAGVTDEVFEAIQVLTEAVLLADHCHRPNYGPWRRRRDQ
jgi:hypothetical protein